MPQGTLEHVNLTVSDIHRSGRLFTDLLGWKKRWLGPAQSGGVTLHLGDQRTYFALYCDGAPVPIRAKGVPLNHVGLLVDDLLAAENIVRAHGLTPFGHGDYAPGWRFYFFDWDGIEFEVVNYEPGCV